MLGESSWKRRSESLVLSIEKVAKKMSSAHGRWNHLPVSRTIEFEHDENLSAWKFKVKREQKLELSVIRHRMKVYVSTFEYFETFSNVWIERSKKMHDRAVYNWASKVIIQLLFWFWFRFYYGLRLAKLINWKDRVIGLVLVYDTQLKSTLQTRQNVRHVNSCTVQNDCTANQRVRYMNFL